MTALLVSLLALPVAILFTVGVPFAFLATRRAQLGLPLGLLLALLLCSMGISAKARPAGVPELALLQVQLGVLLTAAFSGQDTLTLAGTAAFACTLALTLRLRFALPLAVVAAQITAGILITTLPSTTPALVFTTLTLALTLLAPRRQRPGVRDALRPMAFLLTALSALLLGLHLH